MLTAIYIISIVLILLLTGFIVLLVSFYSLRKEIIELRMTVAKNKLPEGYLEKEKMINRFLLDQSNSKSYNHAHLSLADKIMDFIFKHPVKMDVYFHYTKEKLIADRILETGFRFKNSFHKTAVNITEDVSLITYNHLSYKYYGKYILIICLPSDDVKKINNQIAKKHSKQIVIENMLSSKIDTSDNEDIYLLPAKYVKGYFNYETDEITENKNFDPVIDTDSILKAES